MRDQKIREALNQHWAASDANDFETEHRIYHEDAVLEYPQSGERIRGRRNIQITRSIQPNRKRFNPDIQVFVSSSGNWNAFLWGASIPHRIPLSAIHCRISVMSSSVKPKRRRISVRSRSEKISEAV